MNDHVRAAKEYGKQYKNELIIGVTVVIGAVMLLLLIIFLVFNSAPKIMYKPVAACDLFTSEEAGELLGDTAVPSSSREPSLKENTAVSSCGYTDGNPDTARMIVAVLLMRSAVNDEGIQQNKAEFTAGKPSEGVETIQGVGDAAYYNEKLGQLNVLNGRQWMVISYGVGESPESNTKEDALKMAELLVEAQPAAAKF